MATHRAVGFPHVSARLSTFSHPSQQHERDILEFPARCSVEVAIAVPTGIEAVPEGSCSSVADIKSILDTTMADGFYTVRGPLQDLLRHPFLTTYIQTSHENEGAAGHRHRTGRGPIVRTA